MKRVGFVVAMESEYAPFLFRLGSLVREELRCGVGFALYTSDGAEIVLAKCGIGEIASSVAVGLLIGHYSCEYIVNFGLVGSLGSAQLSSIVAVKDVVHYDCDLTAFGHPLSAPADFSSAYFSSDPEMLSVLSARGIPSLRLASGDKFIADVSLKTKLRDAFSADVCDMEGAGVAVACARACVPFTMIKLVSDDAGEGAVSTFEQSKSKGFSFAVDVVFAVIKGV